MDTGILQIALLAAIVAIVVSVYELRASLSPAVCSECPHCRSAAAERQRRDQELQDWYARKHGLDLDDEDDRQRR
jgi:hypothetical protein